MIKKLTRRRLLIKGFTVVELLIVIVVIGILAALVLNTASGVQRKARNLQTIANIRQYADAIEIYKAETGAYPKTPGEGTDYIAMVCLGLNYPGDTCGTITSVQVYKSTPFMTDLATKSGGGVSNSLVNIVPGTVANENFIGAAYGIDTTSFYGPGSRGRMIEWFLEGENQDCILSGAWAYASGNGNTACELDIEVYP